MEAFDVPDGGSLTPKRSESTTAVQAFALLNNRFVIRQSEHIASRFERPSVTPQDAAADLFAHILLRDPDHTERQIIADYADKHGLDNLAQMLINSNEFVYVD